MSPEEQYDRCAVCVHHETVGLRVSTLEERMSRIEKFIFAVLIFFASSSILTVKELYSISDRLGTMRNLSTISSVVHQEPRTPTTSR